MRRHGGGWTIEALVVSLAVLLPAGAFAAATVDGGKASGDRQVTAAGFGQEGIVPDPTRSQLPEPPRATMTPAPPPPSTTTPPNTPSTVTTVSRAAPATPATPVRPPQTTSPTVWTPPGAPPIPSSTIPGGSSWSNRADGVSVRMHIEPARPVAGQPVTFYVDYLIAQDPCCAVALMFGDSPTFTNLAGVGSSCDSPTSLSDLSITHTYAAPGAYESVLATATFPCRPIPGEPFQRAIHGVGLRVCIVVGPGEAGAAGCPSAGPVIHSLPPAGG